VIHFEKDFPETENLVPQVIDHLDQLGASTQLIEEIVKFGVNPGKIIHMALSETGLEFPDLFLQRLQFILTVF
jgi:hypothetical protein